MIFNFPKIEIYEKLCGINFREINFCAFSNLKKISLDIRYSKSHFNYFVFHTLFLYLYNFFSFCQIFQNKFKK